MISVDIIMGPAVREYRNTGKIPSDDWLEKNGGVVNQRWFETEKEYEAYKSGLNDASGYEDAMTLPPVIINPTHNELAPDTKELWGVTFKYDFGDGYASRTLAISECSLFGSEDEANDWISKREGWSYDTAFSPEISSEPKAVLIDRWQS